MRHKKIIAFAMGFILVAFLTQTLWRDRSFPVAVGTIVAFNDTWGSSMSGTSEPCQAPTFGYARVVAVEGAWVELRDHHAFYREVNTYYPCVHFKRTRHWLRAQIQDSVARKAMIASFEKSRYPY